MVIFGFLWFKPISSTFVVSSTLERRNTASCPLIVLTTTTPTLPPHFSNKSLNPKGSHRISEAHDYSSEIKKKKRIPHLTEIVESLQLTNRYSISVFLIKIYCSVEARSCSFNWQWLALPGSLGREWHVERWVGVWASSPAQALLLNLPAPPPLPLPQSSWTAAPSQRVPVCCSNWPFLSWISSKRRRKEWAL